MGVENKQPTLYAVFPTIYWVVHTPNALQQNLIDLDMQIRMGKCLKFFDTSIDSTVKASGIIQHFQVFGITRYYRIFQLSVNPRRWSKTSRLEDYRHHQGPNHK